jgi:excisionase family DNA binding protein
MAGANTKTSQAVKSAELDSQRRTVSVEEAGHILGVSRGSAYALARTGGIPTIRLGKRLLVPKAALEKLLEA